eukprot:c19210_g1_i1 orf=157-1104(+)
MAAVALLPLCSCHFPRFTFGPPYQKQLPRVNPTRPRLAIPASSMASLDGDPIREWILSEGRASKIVRIAPVGGGCVNEANRYVTDIGSFFVKTNRDIGPSMFEAEAIGLDTMYATNTVRVPKSYKAELGRQLAEMHKKGNSNNGFGFMVDNTIGSTPQQNPWTQDWITFYSEYRIGYQLKLAQQQYRDNDLYEKGQKLLQNLPFLFKDLEVKPCLLHGDLWSGNIAADKERHPVILDPASYYGHNEAEFGMSWCAGFSSAFYNAYFEVMPKQPGFEQRRDLYKLYHYLNHYNMFGSGYRSSCTSIFDSYVHLLQV